MIIQVVLSPKIFRWARASPDGDLITDGGDTTEDEETFEGDVDSFIATFWGALFQLVSRHNFQIDEHLQDPNENWFAFVCMKPCITIIIVSDYSCTVTNCLQSIMLLNTLNSFERINYSLSQYAMHSDLIPLDFLSF